MIYPWGRILPPPLSPPEAGRTGLSASWESLCVVLSAFWESCWKFCQLYFYTITPYISCMKNQKMDMFFIACWSKQKKMSNQLQIESYRISMRKLRTFYGKVTEFLNNDKITCLQRPSAFAINGVFWRAERCGYLCRWIDYLCKSADTCRLQLFCHCQYNIQITKHDIFHLQTAV